ncbi:MULTISPECIES: sensor histidine kinase [unclassified Paenibacillus]|uniref:sensor histidine kinase n=1 Tax=unclassified Paenibacillus TaxID=185978 RepID=UPI00278327E0|nr:MULTISPECIES: sensor histidine kinase [unclassified Paenibacillus]MDQ0897796.1 two-component system sensor histidine kinase YesM [Paenibacillus sp. V4I7]MDQ0916209.1 two-component system sensor histidine kinase YesM [Paenibacillus sp. V4I5]
MVRNRIKHFFRFKSIQSTIAVAFSCLIVVTIMVIAWMSYHLSTDAVKKNSRDYTYQLMGQVSSNMDSYINYMDNISRMVLSNYDIKEYLLKQVYLGAIGKEDLKQKISFQLNSVLNTRKDISSILIFGTNGEIIPYNENIKLNPKVDPTEQSWYKKAIEAQGKVVISSSHVQNMILNEYNSVISLSRELSSDVGDEKLGVLLVDLNYSVINDICNKIKLGNRGYVFIVDAQGNIVYHPEQQMINNNQKIELISQVMRTPGSSFVTSEGRNSRMYTIKTSQSTGWKIVGVNYVDELVSNKHELRTYTFFGGIGFLIIAVLLSIILSLRISKPIKHLESSMKEVEKGNFDIQVDIQSSNEIGHLSNRFNRMTIEIKELMLQNIKEQELKRKSELQVLQAQINPHFLYNTLDSIIWMAETGKSKEVILMTASLAKLFRLSISKGQEFISIFNEIEHIKNYLTIQKMRYKSKLDFEINVDKSILSNKLIKIILQPLVENAIYHGVRNNAGKGYIQITGIRKGNRILLQVIDNGIGMSPEEIHKMYQKDRTSEKGSGIGVQNVNQRIKLHFGDPFGLHFESELGRGTTVNIWLPVIE